MRSTDRKIALATLAEGMPGLTPACGKSLAEAAAVCLENREHEVGVTFHLTGMKTERFPIEWSVVDEQMRRTYADLQEATELGACAIAIILVRDLTGMVVVERSKKGPGFDYWLGNENDEDDTLFAGSARLDASGILSGSTAIIQSRLRQKREQIKRSDSLGAGYIAIVEFGTPAACVEQA